MCWIDDLIGIGIGVRKGRFVREMCSLLNEETCDYIGIE